MFIESDATDEGQLRQERHVWLATLLTELILTRSIHSIDMSRLWRYA